MHRRPLLAALVACAACATSPAGPSSGAAQAQAVAPSSTLAPGTDARCGRADPVACRTLGRAYLLGQGVAQDDRLAAAFTLKACELGDAAACSDLGVLSAIGRGVPQGDARAVALSRRSCEGGFALACSNLGVLTVEGANVLSLRPDELGEGGSKTARAFKAACDAGVPEGCLNWGTVVEAGGLVAKDAPAAARALRRACDAGLALACHRLGLLWTRYPSVAPDASPASLHATACAAGIAPACDLAKLGVPPASSRTPSTRLVSETQSLALGIPGAGGFHPSDLASGEVVGRKSREEVRRPTEPLLAAVPPQVRERLGLAAAPRPGGGDDPPVDLLVSLRRQQLGSCYEAERKNPGVRTEVLVVFLVEGDGRPAEVRPAAIPADAELEACAAEVVGGWEFTMPAGGLGGPYLVRYTFDPAPAGSAPQLTPPGGLRPSPKSPGCVERKLKVPADYRGIFGGATVKLAVDGNGSPILLHAITPAPDPVMAAISDAVRACEWAPGADAGGRSATLWLTLPVRAAP
jgi:TPR repeat protein